jgi:hypothetical protein
LINISRSDLAVCRSYLVGTPFLNIALRNASQMRDVFCRFTCILHQHDKDFLFLPIDRDKRVKTEEEYLIDETYK